MRKIIGTMGATLAIVGVIATSASADPVRSFHSGGINIGLADGSVRFVTWSVPILPYIEQENLYRLSGGINSSMGDGSVRFSGDSIAQQTWSAANSPSGGEFLGTDYATVTSMMGDSESEWFEDHGEGDQLDELSAAITLPTSANSGDGSVSPVRDSISPTTSRAIGSYNGGEVVSEF